MCVNLMKLSNKILDKRQKKRLSKLPTEQPTVIYKQLVNMRKNKIIYVFAGPNGSGKSTVINSRRKQLGFPALYICPDLLVPADKKNDKDEYIKAMQKAEETRFNAIQNEESFAFETVLSNPEKLDFIKFAKSKGYYVVATYICGA